LAAGGRSLALEMKTWAASDINTDDAVNGLDLFGFSKEYQRNNQGNPADLDGNGNIESNDLIDLLKGMK
ncbi:MAG: hypothetical protein HUU16_19695, partial [Candidatus Omnitrophica bacterium]|nr:hypothetical protein [Candidatus Omnitrophota bacterium]